MSTNATNPTAPGRTEHLVNFPSRSVKARNADVWLPKDYPQPGTYYAVPHMQNDQHLLDPKNSYGDVA